MTTLVLAPAGMFILFVGVALFAASQIVNQMLLGIGL